MMLAGNIPLDRNHIFYWMVAQGGEIYGFIEDEGGAVISESSGWYRTESAKAAAQTAADRFGFTVLQQQQESNG